MSVELDWNETYDDMDNSVWEAASSFIDGEDGSPFMWRLTQQLESNRIAWCDSSDGELLDGDTPFYPTLEEAKAACQRANDGIVHELSEDPDP